MLDQPQRISPSIRRARAADAQAMFDLAQRAYAPYVDRMDARPGPMDADYLLAIERSESWVIDGTGGTVIALLVLSSAPEHLRIDNVAVDPSEQGRGIGRALLLLAEDRARALGLDEIRLFTHVSMVENQRIYESHGYSETHREADTGFHRVHYRKRLEPSIR